MRTTDPAVTFLLVLAIGIVVGVLFDRLAGRSWLARQFSGSTRGTRRVINVSHCGSDWCRCSAVRLADG
jgi:hypothetical protein